MNKPSFKENKYYPFKLINCGSEFVAEGFMNEKAFNKSIENNCIWEFIVENERVIEKNIGDIKNKHVSFQLNSGVIEITLSDKEKKLSCSEEEVLHKLELIIQKRLETMPENSYTTHLFSKGEDKILKKLGEEAVELILAKENKEEIIYESADLIYHLIVYLVYKKIPLNNILQELERRMH